MSTGQSYHLQEDTLPSLQESTAKGQRIKTAEKTDFYICQKRSETHSRKVLLPLIIVVMGLVNLALGWF